MGSGSTVGSPTVIGMSAGRIGDKYFVVKSRGGKQCGRGGNVGIAAENMKVECFRDSAWKVAAETLGSRRKTASVRCRRKVKCFRVIAFGSRRKRCVGAAKTNVKRLPRQGVVVNIMEVVSTVRRKYGIVEGGSEMVSVGSVMAGRLKSPSISLAE